MTTVIFHHGDKGGVGKSLFCKTYIDAKMVTDKDNLVVVDADARNPDIGWIYRDHGIPVHNIDLRSAADTDGQDPWMLLADLIEENKGKKIVVNLPAGVGTMLTEKQHFFGEIIKNLEVKVEMFFSIDRQKTSIVQLKAGYPAFKSFMKLEDLTIIKNGFFGPSADHFFEWNKSKLKKELIAAGAKEVFIPELHYRVIESVDRKPFSVALADGMKTSDRVVLEAWLREARTALGVA